MIIGDMYFIYKKIKNWKKDESPKRGDHIRLSHLNGLSSKHGIYISDDEVIYLTNHESDKFKYEIKNCCLDEFLDTGFLWEGSIDVRQYNNYELRYRYPVEQIEANARSCIGKEGYYPIDVMEQVGNNIKDYFRKGNIIIPSRDEIFVNACIFGNTRKETGKWTKKKPVEGDHIRVKRWIGYYHHGIYVSDDEIIHFSSRDGENNFVWSKGIIGKTDLVNFLENGEPEVREYTDEELQNRCPVEQIVSNARKRINEGEYNLLFNNCEHFANECVFGNSRSEQAEVAEDIMDLIANVMRF